jgi:VWFA-related protein
MKMSLYGFVVIAALSATGLAQPAEEKPASFGERLDVEVVNVDVIVTDASGRRVTDLAKEDFRLEVDGKLVAIDYFAPPGARPAAAAAAGSEMPESSAVDLSRANLFVFVDQSALEYRASGKVLEEISAFVLPRTGGSERIMIAAFAENLRILTPPTTDRKRIEEAFAELEKLRGRGSLVAAERGQLEREVRANARPRAQPQIIDPETGEVGEVQVERERVQDQMDLDVLRSQIETFGQQQIDRQTRAVAALREWIGALAAIDGRKSVLFASSGYNSQPDAFLTRYLEEKRSKPTERGQIGQLPTANLALLDDFEATVRAAQNARVAFYTISPREAPSVSAGAEFTGSGMKSTSLPPRDPALVESASSLQRLAGSTGGSALVLDDSLSDRLSMVADDAAASYSLGFSTGVTAGTGDHAIRVRTVRGDLSVRHRESFRRSSLAERAEAALVAAATFETTVNPLGLRLELGVPEPMDKKGKEAMVPILVRIPLALVTLLPEGERHSARLLARVAVLNEARHIRLGETAPIVISIPAGELERAQAGFWAYRAEVMVSRGSQRVAVVVSDEIAGTVSTLTSLVERPAGSFE